MEKCHTCGQDCIPTSPISTGYGVDREGNKHCFSCCAEQDRQYMREHGRITLYFAYDLETRQAKWGEHGSMGCERYEVRPRVTNPRVTNWPDSLSFPVTYYKKGRHNMAGTRYDVYFTFENTAWHGVQYGENTQLCHCKRLKG